MSVRYEFFNLFSFLRSFFVQFVLLVFLIIFGFFLFSFLKDLGKEDFYSCVEILSLPLNPCSLPFVSSFSKRGVRYCYEILVLEKRARLRLWIFAKLRPKNAREVMRSLTSKVLGSLKASNPQMRIVERNSIDLECFCSENVLSSLVKDQGFPKGLSGGSWEYFGYLSSKALPVKPFENFLDRLLDVCVGLDCDFSISFVFCEKWRRNYKPHAHFWGRGKHVLEDRNKAEWKEDLSSKHYARRSLVLEKRDLRFEGYKTGLYSFSFYIVLKAKSVGSLSKSLYTVQASVSALLSDDKTAKVKVSTRFRKVRKELNFNLKRVKMKTNITF